MHLSLIPYKETFLRLVSLSSWAYYIIFKAYSKSFKTCLLLLFKDKKLLNRQVAQKTYLQKNPKEHILRQAVPPGDVCIWHSTSILCRTLSRRQEPLSDLFCRQVKVGIGRQSDPARVTQQIKGRSQTFQMCRILRR